MWPKGSLTGGLSPVCIVDQNVGTSYTSAVPLSPSVGMRGKVSLVTPLTSCSLVLYSTGLL